MRDIAAALQMNSGGSLTELAAVLPAIFDVAHHNMSYPHTAYPHTADVAQFGGDGD